MLTADANAPRTGIRVLLVDDMELVRSGLRLLVDTSLGHDVVEARDADEAVELARTIDPDVVLLDVRMPGRDGLWVLRRLRELRPEIRVVMLSGFTDPEAVRQALDAGACGFLLKDSHVAQVAEAIETAMTGDGLYLHPKVAERLLRSRDVAHGEHLTSREAEVLKLLAEGATNDEIAAGLFITEKTVKSHLWAIFRKLGVTNRTAAATMAMREGLVDD